jgi:hypothetical protein
MIYQTDLESSIAFIACYYRSIAYYREYGSSYEWNREDLNRDWKLCLVNKYIDSKTQNIIDPSGVAKILGCDIRFLGKYYPADYKPEFDHFIIACWKKNRETDDAHFCVHDNSGIYTKEHCLFDPWSEKGSNTVNSGLITSLRIFKRV